MRKDRRSAVFILTNGRSKNVTTYNTLSVCGYSGPIYLVCDDEDSHLDKYIEKYGEESVLVFNKQKAIDETDSGDNFKKRNSVVYARNESFNLAKKMGLTHFLQLDDDYSTFRYSSDNQNKYITSEIKLESLGDIIEAFFDFLDDSGADSIAFSQGGDWIGGDGGAFGKYLKQNTFSRKVMNSFFFRVDRPLKFMGRINEDVNLYVLEGRKGSLFITPPRIRLEQKDTQSNAGGLTDIYLDLGTYIKSFYSVIYAPSCVNVTVMGCTDARMHHRVSWRHAVPKIIGEEHKKHKINYKEGVLE